MIELSRENLVTNEEGVNSGYYGDKERMRSPVILVIKRERGITSYSGEKRENK